MLPKSLLWSAATNWTCADPDPAHPSASSVMNTAADEAAHPARPAGASKPGFRMRLVGLGGRHWHACAAVQTWPDMQSVPLRHCTQAPTRHRGVALEQSWQFPAGHAVTRSSAQTLLTAERPDGDRQRGHERRASRPDEPSHGRGIARRRRSCEPVTSTRGPPPGTMGCPPSDSTEPSRLTRIVRAAGWTAHPRARSCYLHQAKGKTNHVPWTSVFETHGFAPGGARPHPHDGRIGV
jgi:hypothetical protein